MFSIPEADTIVYPRTMVIHVENTTIAGRAVVTTIRFEYIAHETVPLTLILRISHIESL
jgi:hypothetical protein